MKEAQKQNRIIILLYIIVVLLVINISFNAYINIKESYRQKTNRYHHIGNGRFFDKEKKRVIIPKYEKDEDGHIIGTLP